MESPTNLIGSLPHLGFAWGRQNGNRLPQPTKQKFAIKKKKIEVCFFIF